MPATAIQTENIAQIVSAAASIRAWSRASGGGPRAIVARCSTTSRCVSPTRPAPERFYATVLATLGVERTGRDERSPSGRTTSRSAGHRRAAADAQPPPRLLRPLARRRARVLARRAWMPATRTTGSPARGPRYTPEYFGGFLRDPDGNSVEAVFVDEPRTEGAIDHLWIRVADVAAATRLLRGDRARYAGIRARATRSRVGCSSPVRRAARSRCRRRRPVTEQGAPRVRDGRRRRRWRPSTARRPSFGHRDNGAPGERPEYHPGYFGAYVLDPDGNNVEVVNHNR